MLSPPGTATLFSNKSNFKKNLRRVRALPVVGPEKPAWSRERQKNSSALMVARIVLALVLVGGAEFFTESQMFCADAMDLKDFPGLSPIPTLALPSLSFGGCNFS